MKTKEKGRTQTNYAIALFLFAINGDQRHEKKHTIICHSFVLFCLIMIIIIIIIMDNFCIALFFIRNELTALYTFTQRLMLPLMYTRIYSAVESLHVNPPG